MAWTTQEFIKRIRDKYPEYSDIDNATLVTKMLEKYPEYRDDVNLETTPDLQQKIKTLIPAPPLTALQQATKAPDIETNYQTKDGNIATTAVGSALKTILPWVKGEDIDIVFPRQTDWAGKAAEVTGGLAGGAIPFGALGKATAGIKALQAIKGAPLASNVLKSAGKGALEMGAYNLAGSALAGKPAEEVAKETATGALIGGALGAGAGYVFGKFSNKFQSLKKPADIIDESKAYIEWLKNREELSPIVPEGRNVIENKFLEKEILNIKGRLKKLMSLTAKSGDKGFLRAERQRVQDDLVQAQSYLEALKSRAPFSPIAKGVRTVRPTDNIPPLTELPRPAGGIPAEPAKLPFPKGGIPVTTEKYAGSINLTKYPEEMRGTIAQAASEAGLQTKPIFTASRLVALKNEVTRTESGQLKLLQQVTQGKEGRLAAELDLARDKLADTILEISEKAGNLLSPEILSQTKTVSKGARESSLALLSLKRAKATEKILAVNKIIEEKMKTAVPEEIKQLQEMQKALQQFAKNNPEMIDKWVEWATAIKLTNPWTHIRNIGGNTIATLERPIVKTLAGSYNLIESKLRGKPQEIYTREGLADLVGQFRGIRNGWSNAIKAMLDENYAATQLGKVGEVESQGAIKGLKGQIIRTPFRALSAMDEFFRSIRHSAEANTMAEREALQKGLSGIERTNYVQSRTDKLLKLVKASIVAGREPGIDTSRGLFGGVKVMSTEGLKPWEQIRKLASESLYQSQLNPFYDFLNKLRNKFPAVKLIIPFFRTIVNLEKWSFQRSPLGLLSSRNIEGITGNPVPRAEALARITEGAILSGGITWMANEGHITGRPPKEKAKRDLLYATGWQPYSIKLTFPDGKVRYISYRGFEPLATYFSTIADLVAGWKEAGEAEEDDYLKVTMMAAKNITEQPFLMGVNGFLDSLDDPGKTPEFLAQFLQGIIVPTGVRYAGKGMSRDLKEAKTFPEKLIKGVPFLQDKLPNRVNVLGEEVKLEENPYLRLLGVSTAREYRLAEEMARLNVLPTYPSKTILIKNMKGQVTDEEYREFLRIRGEYYKQSLLPVVENNRYLQSDDEKRQEILKSARDKISNNPAFSKIRRIPFYKNLERLK